jgi:hypothetical protein
MDEEPTISTVDRRRLLYYAWGIAGIATVFYEIPLLIFFPFFPSGLTFLFGLRGVADAIGQFVTWAVYYVLIKILLRTEQRRRYFIIYGILCCILLLNVVGCHQGFRAIK